MGAYMLPALFSVLGVANMVMLWRWRPASGLIGVIGFGGLALVSMSWLDGNAVPSTMPLSLLAALVSAISVYTGYVYE